MKLVLNGHDERYIVEQSLMNLFPGEPPVYEPILPEDAAIPMGTGFSADLDGDGSITAMDAAATCAGTSRTTASAAANT